MAHVRSLLQDIRGYLEDQGTLHLQGLDVASTLLQVRPQAISPALAARPAAPSATPPPQPEAKSHEALVPETLKEVRDDLGACQRCMLSQGRTSIVFGVGDPEASLMFVGEAPGRDEDLLGEPFVGEAGQLLDRMLHAMGLHRGQVYIVNIIKCRPPKNRFPAADEVAQCSPFVRRQIRVIKPQVVVALGRLAAHTLMGTQESISRLRGQWSQYEGAALMPTFHPAYLLRVPKDKALVWQDLQQVMAKIGLRGR